MHTAMNAASNDIRKRGRAQTPGASRTIYSLGVTLGALLFMSALSAALIGSMRWSLRGETVTTLAGGAAPIIDVRAILDSDAYARGKAHFVNTCTGCHTPEGRGMPGLGLNIVPSNYVAGASDDELVDFIWQGRQPGHPENMTGRDMPSRGGNPALSRDDVRDIIVYIRGLEAVAATNATH